MTTRAGPGHAGITEEQNMELLPNPQGTLAAEAAAQNPDLAQTIEECTGDHGATARIEECMNESAKQLAANEARRRRCGDD